MKKKKNIIFAGDSFTWGEGLSLYLEKEPWISQRNKKSEWFDLRELQTEESKLFRNKYRFSTAVSDYFNCNPIVARTNGGDFDTICKLIVDNINDDTFAVVLQFTHIRRMLLHLRPYECGCKYCNWSIENGFGPSLIDSYMQIINYHVDNKKEAPYLFWKNIEFLKMYQTNPYPILTFEQWDKLSVHDKDLWIDKFTKTIFISIDREIRKNFNDLAVFLQKKVENIGIPLFLIDTWDGEWTRRMILENKYLMERIIPLESPNGRKYTNWADWKETVKPYEIAHEFPNTSNHHPTLTSNVLLYKSLVKEMKSKLNIKSNKKLSYYDNIEYEIKGISDKPLI